MVLVYTAFYVFRREGYFPASETAGLERRVARKLVNRPKLKRE